MLLDVELEPRKSVSGINGIPEDGKVIKGVFGLGLRISPVNGKTQFNSESVKNQIHVILIRLNEPDHVFLGASD
ncbi:hypothetical protein PGT21_016355 [Puccinia graminis f. sp. tritici]|uniref:Uncharacterized protein n=1 Tax=Puccinia graminis f. sp. tritici TaxID=56615 RepID=A0A5B0MNW4_PUCGR|nr:hypothetical protein PGT21_016355 [Puccinia graminis f. sp. tritici]